jgi:rare lipoprotein A
VTKLLINLLIIFLLISCQLQNNYNPSTIIDDERNFIKKVIISEKKPTVSEKKATVSEKNTIVSENKDVTINVNTLKYIVGEPYFIDGVEYIPSENYSFNQVGLATYYDKELHNQKTVNNDLNKVTELLGRHKTLPIPSIVKITNLENGFSLVIKINDRHDDNSSIIQVSRKTAQLLRFYKSKIARVKVEIIADPSKQIKIVTQSMNETNFNDTIQSVPTEDVSISNLDENLISEKLNHDNVNSPIEMDFEEVTYKDLYLKVYGFNSYVELNNLISVLGINYKFLTQKEGDNYSLLLGPLENKDVNNLVTTFISKGYKKNDIILE